MTLSRSNALVLEALNEVGDLVREVNKLDQDILEVHTHLKQVLAEINRALDLHSTAVTKMSQICVADLMKTTRDLKLEAQQFFMHRQDAMHRADTNAREQLFLSFNRSLAEFRRTAFYACIAFGVIGIFIGALTQYLA